MKITVGNSISRIEFFTEDQFKLLKKHLSYVEKNHFMWNNKHKHMVRRLIDKHGHFPTGLLYIVELLIKNHKWVANIHDERKRPNINKKPSLFTGVHPTPYPEQKEAAILAHKMGRGIIVAPTGCGKTRLAAEIINEIQAKTLIVVPSLELKNQVTEAMTGFFGKNFVGPLSKGKTKFFITVENVDQLEKLRTPPDVDCVIVDEFHRSGSKTYRNINKKLWNNVYYKLGLTATPFRSRAEEHILMESVLSRIIYNIPYESAVQSGYIVPMEGYYYDLEKYKSNFRKFAEAYKALVVEREDRNKLIVDLITNLHNAGKSTLVLVKQIEHGLKLQEKALERGIEVPFAQGINEDNKSIIEAFNSTKLHVLIGTSGVLGEGIDTRPCEYVILAGGGKSKNAFMQQCGRGFRRFKDKETCKIILFRDSSNKWLLDHFNSCKKHLAEEYALLPIKLENNPS